MCIIHVVGPCYYYSMFMLKKSQKFMRSNYACIIELANPSAIKVPLFQVPLYQATIYAYHKEWDKQCRVRLCTPEVYCDGIWFNKSIYKKMVFCTALTSILYRVTVLKLCITVQLKTNST